MNMMTKQVKLNRIGGSWSTKNLNRTMSMMDAINWINKNGYTLRWARTGKTGNRRLVYHKEGCNTEYEMVIPA